MGRKKQLGVALDDQVRLLLENVARKSDRSIADGLFKVRLLATGQVLIVRRGQPSLICINPHIDVSLKCS